FLLSGFYPSATTLNASAVQLNLRHPDLTGKTVTLADAAGNPVATVHILAETADGYLSGSFDSSAWHFRNPDGTLGLAVTGYVGPDFWSPTLGGGWSGPAISFHGSAWGTTTVSVLPGFMTAVADLETVDFQGRLYQDARGLGMGGSFDETDTYQLWPGYLPTA